MARGVRSPQVAAPASREVAVASGPAVSVSRLEDLVGKEVELVPSSPYRGDEVLRARLVSVNDREMVVTRPWRRSQQYAVYPRIGVVGCPWSGVIFCVTPFESTDEGAPPPASAPVKVQAVTLPPAAALSAPTKPPAAPPAPTKAPVATKPPAAPTVKEVAPSVDLDDDEEAAPAGEPEVVEEDDAQSEPDVEDDGEEPEAGDSPEDDPDDDAVDYTDDPKED